MCILFPPPIGASYKHCFCVLRAFCGCRSPGNHNQAPGRCWERERRRGSIPGAAAPRCIGGSGCPAQTATLQQRRVTAAHRPGYGGGTHILHLAGICWAPGLGRLCARTQGEIRPRLAVMEAQSRGESSTKQKCGHDQVGSPTQQAGIPGDGPVVLVTLAARRM